MHHYVSLFVQCEDGTWRGCLPDFSGCETTGKSLELAILNVAASLVGHTFRRRAPLPPPKTLAEVADDRDWLSANGVMLASAIVVMTPYMIGQLPMGSKENKDRGQDLFTFLQQPLPLRPPGQTNSEEGIMRDRAFAERAETTERLKALRLAHSAASAEQQPPKRRSKVR